MIRTLISVALLAILGACGTNPASPRSEAQQRLDGYRTAYLSANLLIAGYAFLPVCGDKIQPPCSDLNVLSALRGGSALVGSALTVAQASIDSPEALTNLERVNLALLALTQMLVDYRLR